MFTGFRLATNWAYIRYYEQAEADGVKLALKEDLIPKAADKVVFVLAPVIAVIPAFVTFSVVPFGPEVTMFGERTPLQLTDMPVAVLFVMAIASIGIYGIVLGVILRFTQGFLEIAGTGTAAMDTSSAWRLSRPVVSQSMAMTSLPS